MAPTLAPVKANQVVAALELVHRVDGGQQPLLRPLGPVCIADQQRIDAPQRDPIGVLMARADRVPAVGE